MKHGVWVSSSSGNDSIHARAFLFEKIIPHSPPERRGWGRFGQQTPCPLLGGLCYNDVMNSALKYLTIPYALLALGAIAYFSIMQPENYVVVGISALIVLLPIFFVSTEYGVLTLIVIRPIIDAFSGYTIITIQNIGLNMNSVLGVMVCVWGVYVILKESIHWKDVTGRWWILALLLWSGICFVSTISFTSSLSEWLRIASVLVIFVVAQHIAKHDQHFIVWVINAVAISAVVPILVGFYQLVTYGGLSWGDLSNRIYGTFGHPNVLAFYMVMLLSVTIVRHFSAPHPHRSLLYPWILMIGIVTLLFTYTRGAWIGFGLVLFILGVFKYRKPLIITSAVVCLILVSGQVVNTVLINNFNLNLNDIPLVNRFTTRNDEADSINWRLEVFQKMAPKVLDRPVFGVGLGNFVTLRQQGDIGLFDDPEAHDDYLRLAIEIGIPGLLLYVGFLLTLLFSAWKHYWHAGKDAWQKTYAIGFGGLILAFIIMSAGDNLLQETPVMWTFMLIVGSMLGMNTKSDAI